MTVIPFPHRMADELRLAARSAYNDGDFRMAQRLLTVLHTYVARVEHLSAGSDRCFPEHDEWLVQPRASNDG
jgi:hypothetical protein